VNFCFFFIYFQKNFHLFSSISSKNVIYFYLFLWKKIIYFSILFSRKKWQLCLRSCKKFRTFNFFHCFWLALDRNLMMADLVSQIEGVRTFFLWNFLILSHFLNLKSSTEDSRQRHGRDFETPFLYRAAVTGLVINFYGCRTNIAVWNILRVCQYSSE
jgi:hypothetical protein